MNGPNLQPPPPRETELEVGDLTQQIDSPLDEFLRPNEPTLSKVDFDELEIKLDF